MMEQSASVAIIYDFDGTLAPGNIQEPVLLRLLGETPDEFWSEVDVVCQKNNADNILVYMDMILRECVKKGVSLKRSQLHSWGMKTSYFRGVQTWFENINVYCNRLGIECKHYILSSANKEIIEGTSIAHNFEEIFASSYVFNENDVAIAPGVGINYTGKTQYLYRINKGYYDVWDTIRINQSIPAEQRDVPFENMIYIGDGFTDIPCLKLVKQNGGHSIAVYDPQKKQKKLFDTQQLLWHNRVNAYYPADYSKRSKLYQYITCVLSMIAERLRKEKLERDCIRKLPIDALIRRDKEDEKARSLK